MFSKFLFEDTDYKKFRTTTSACTSIYRSNTLSPMIMIFTHNYIYYNVALFFCIFIYTQSCLDVFKYID